MVGTHRHSRDKETLTVTVDDAHPLQAVAAFIQQPAHFALPPPQHACTVPGKLPFDRASYNAQQLAAEADPSNHPSADALA